jgi:hypothetical protein
MYQGNGGKRYSAPTTPEPTREMKTPSNYANHLCQKAATVAWSACGCLPSCFCSGITKAISHHGTKRYHSQATPLFGLPAFVASQHRLFGFPFPQTTL